MFRGWSQDGVQYIRIISIRAFPLTYLMLLFTEPEMVAFQSENRAVLLSISPSVSCFGLFQARHQPMWSLISHPRDRFEHLRNVMKGAVCGQNHTATIMLSDTIQIFGTWAYWYTEPL